MEAAPSLETVFQALYALYRNPDISGKEKASIWLGELQRSVYAWQVSDQLLQLNKDVESCYFAAQTMRTKIQYAFNELPQGSHASLRDSLLNHVGKINEETPPVIATQLCLALADLALQMVVWKGATKDLIDRFGTDTKHVHFLIEVLTVLPEEVNSASLRLGKNRRTEVTEELAASSGIMIKVLEATLDTSTDARLQAKVFRCLGSWFSIGVIPQENIINSKVLMEPFKTLLNVDCSSQLHEAASDCICSALYAAEIRNHSELEKRSQLAMNLMQGVLALPEAYHVSVAMEDIDKSINLCRIFTEMAESFLDIIVATPNQGFGDLRTVELLLTCVGHYQYEVADITFNFWYRLSDHLFQINNSALTEIFKPYIQRLIVALCRHCQFDPDHEGIPNDKDEFSDFRKRVSELIKDVVFIIGSAACFTQMFENLKSQSSDASWDSSEAALFVMTAVAKNIMPNESTIVPQVVQAILNLPDTTHIALRYTSTQLIGELNEWIQEHAEFLDPVLQFLLQGLQNPQLANAAATSLRSICSRCRNEMVNHFVGLLQITQAMDSFKVSNDAAIGLLRGTAAVLSKMPHEKITEGLRQLCGLQVAPLQKVLEQPETSNGNSKGTDPTIWLDRLAAIFSSLSVVVTNGQTHPCKPAIQEVWPILSSTCTKYQADVKVIERCCRCIRFAIRCLGKDSEVLLTPLVTQMVQLYSVHQHSCFLYLGSILVDEYGKEEGFTQGLIDMLIAFSGPTFKLLEEANGLRNHPDTIDDLFRLCLRFIQQAPVAFLQCSIMNAIVACAIASCPVSHRDANSSLTKFLLELTKSATGSSTSNGPEDARKQELIKGLLSEHGASLVQSIINACLFHLPSYMIVDSAHVLHALLQVDKQAVSGWLEQTLKTLPTHNAGGAVTATPEQLSDFLEKVCKETDEEKVVNFLREFARLYR